MFWLRQRFIDSRIGKYIFISTMQFQLKTRKQICLWCGCYVLRYRNFRTIAIRFRSFAGTRKAHCSVCVSKTPIIYLNFTDRKKWWYMIHQQWAPAIRNGSNDCLGCNALGFYSTEYKCYNATPCTLSSCNILFNLTLERKYTTNQENIVKKEYTKEFHLIQAFACWGMRCKEEIEQSGNSRAASSPKLQIREKYSLSELNERRIK